MLLRYFDSVSSGRKVRLSCLLKVWQCACALTVDVLDLRCKPNSWTLNFPGPFASSQPLIFPCQNFKAATSRLHTQQSWASQTANVPHRWELIPMKLDLKHLKWPAPKNCQSPCMPLQYSPTTSTQWCSSDFLVSHRVLYYETQMLDYSSRNKICIGATSHLQMGGNVRAPIHMCQLLFFTVLYAKELFSCSTVMLIFTRVTYLQPIFQNVLNYENMHTVCCCTKCYITAKGPPMQAVAQIRTALLHLMPWPSCLREASQTW